MRRQCFRGLSTNSSVSRLSTSAGMALTREWRESLQENL